MFTQLPCISHLLLQLFYPSLLSESPLPNDCTIASNEWEYMPPVGQRPHNGFVGLKNAGATCYMNSVLQLLFMIKPIWNKIFVVNLSCAESSDDLNEPNDDSHSDTEIGSDKPVSENELRKEYNLSIF